MNDLEKDEKNDPLENETHCLTEYEINMIAQLKIIKKTIRSVKEMLKTLKELERLLELDM